MALKGFANAALLQTGHGPLWAWIKRITNATEAASAAPVQPVFAAQVSLVAGVATLLLPVAIDPLTAVGTASYQVEGPAPLGVLRVSFPDPTHVMITSLDPTTGATILTDTSRITVTVLAP